MRESELGRDFSDEHAVRWKGPEQGADLRSGHRSQRQELPTLRVGAEREELVASGIDERDARSLFLSGYGCEHGLQRGDANDWPGKAQAQTLRERYPHAQPHERSGADAHGDAVHAAAGPSRVSERPRNER